MEVTVLKFSKLSLEIDDENLLYFYVNLSLLPTEKDYSPYVTYQQCDLNLGTLYILCVYFDLSFLFDLNPYILNTPLVALVSIELHSLLSGSRVIAIFESNKWFTDCINQDMLNFTL